MILDKKVAVIYGAGGGVGGAVAHAFAREGAQVFLTGHRLALMESVVSEILASGGSAEAAEVDAVNESAVDTHLGGAHPRPFRRAGASRHSRGRPAAAGHA